MLLSGQQHAVQVRARLASGPSTSPEDLTVSLALGQPGKPPSVLEVGKIIGFQSAAGFRFLKKESDEKVISAFNRYWLGLRSDGRRQRCAYWPLAIFCHRLLF